ncbi:hypothetical protein DDI_0237 [Dickeya dianthicola RNS04.9]|nr:hypothetical protein [Dickeya dianthicola]ATO31405.1 hypothetical protein DDI_0237 [Dickeya dianthicola RNS04.9]
MVESKKAKPPYRPAVAVAAGGEHGNHRVTILSAWHDIVSNAALADW